MVKFGDFNGICEKVALTVCPLVGAEEGIEPTCYSRNVEIAGTLIFQPGNINNICIFIIIIFFWFIN